jgi:hypothetical protein
VSNPDWWKKAGEPYKGVTIKGISESTPHRKLRWKLPHLSLKN